MLFRIKRSSSKVPCTYYYEFDRNDPPCKNAVVKTETKERLYHYMHGDGSEREVYKDSEEPYWVVEINTIEDLMELQKEVGWPLIVSDNEIEVYDDYRE